MTNIITNKIQNDKFSQEHGK